jgi:DNA polymerase-3 subunit epsilon
LTNAYTVIILDFETTGLSPDMGDRAIEIGAVRIENGIITERFQELMNPGQPISSFIEDYTGITNNMLYNAPPCEEVMNDFADFIDGYNLVAHNASFDKRFLDAELNNISRTYSGKFACSMLASRRIYQNAPDHKLGTLINYTNIPSDGTFHRALYDSEMTTKLWISMLDELDEQYNLQSIPFTLIQQLTKIPKKSVHDFLENL